MLRYAGWGGSDTGAINQRQKPKRRKKITAPRGDDAWSMLLSSRSPQAGSSPCRPTPERVSTGGHRQTVGEGMRLRGTGLATFTNVHLS